MQDISTLLAELAQARAELAAAQETLKPFAEREAAARQAIEAVALRQFGETGQKKVHEAVTISERLSVTVVDADKAEKYARDHGLEGLLRLDRTAFKQFVAAETKAGARFSKAIATTAWETTVSVKTDLSAYLPHAQAA